MDKYSDEKKLEGVRTAYPKVIEELINFRKACPTDKLSTDKINNLLSEWIIDLIDNKWEDGFDTYAKTVKRELVEISDHLYQFKKVIDSYIYKLEAFNFNL